MAASAFGRGGAASLLLVAAVLAMRHVLLMGAAYGGGAPLSPEQQRAWQSRWRQTGAAVVGASTSRVAASLPSFSPPSPPADCQAPEARRAVAMALTQLIPEKGDGRRGGYDDQRNVKRESDTVRRMLRQDGLDEWWPDPALLPPQQPAGASMAELLHAVPTNDTAWLAFGNAGATEMLMNWVYHTLKLKLGSKLVIAAYDNELLTYLRVRKLPAYNCVYATFRPGQRFGRRIH